MIYDWSSEARCLGLTELFFLDGRMKEARNVCGECPCQRPCLDFALADPTLVGIWGGTDERERNRMRRNIGTVDGSN